MSPAQKLSRYHDRGYEKLLRGLTKLGEAYSPSPDTNKGNSSE